MRFALTLGLLLLAGPALAQQPRPATCSRDLFQNEAGFRLQQTRLAAVATADQATQCRTFRDHVAYLQKARSVFAACQSGAERERNVAEMDSELVNYRALIANRCGGR
jgi:methylaspartate ammonia-lyase